MDLDKSCRVLLEKGNTQKVKCALINSKLVERELAIHEDVDLKGKTSISDPITGVRLAGIDKDVNNVTLADVNERLEKFVKHFTIEEIRKEFKRWEEKVENGKKKK